MRVFGPSRAQEEISTDDNLSLPLDFDALSGFNGLLQNESCNAIEEEHEQNEDSETEAAPVSRFSRAAILE